MQLDDKIAHANILILRANLIHLTFIPECSLFQASEFYQVSTLSLLKTYKYLVKGKKASLGLIHIKEFCITHSNILILQTVSSL